MTNRPASTEAVISETVASERVASAASPDWAGLPRLGVGLGFRTPYRADLFLNASQVDFLEMVADHYFEAEPDKLAELELLQRHFPLIPHGLTLSLGSAAGVRSETVRQLAALVGRVNPPWWSEHIAFTQAGGQEIGHLAPVSFTRTSLQILSQNIASVRQEIPTPLILENITYQATFPWSELDEAAFLGELLERTGCGLLLDVTNLYTNSINHRFDPLKFLDRLPSDRIVQLHFVGGHWRDGTLIDSHSQPTPDEVWQLLDEVLKRAPVKGIILERDENFPPFSEIVPELQRARGLWLGRTHVAEARP